MAFLRLNWCRDYTNMIFKMPSSKISAIWLLFSAGDRFPVNWNSVSPRSLPQRPSDMPNVGSIIFSGSTRPVDHRRPLSPTLIGLFSDLAILAIFTERFLTLKYINNTLFSQKFFSHIFQSKIDLKIFCANTQLEQVKTGFFKNFIYIFPPLSMALAEHRPSFLH